MLQFNTSLIKSNNVTKHPLACKKFSLVYHVKEITAETSYDIVVYIDHLSLNENYNSLLHINTETAFMQVPLICSSWTS